MPMQQVLPPDKGQEDLVVRGAGVDFRLGRTIAMGGSTSQ